MKALSVKQPWAELIASGDKQVETRSVPTHHRGPLAIHASLRADLGPVALHAWLEARHSLAAASTRTAEKEVLALPAGRVVAVAKLASCEPFHPSHEGQACTPWRPNAWAWRLDDARRADSPFPVKGQLGLWNIPDSAIQEAA
jgi:activating signal cointegrator 1